MLSTHFPKAQQCTYNYYLGRHSLYSASESAASLIPAFTALSTAYSLCPAVCPSQLRQILIYLIVAGILVGKMPNEGVWHRAEAYGLREIFYPIGQCVRKGDFRGFRNELRRNGDWLKKKGLYLILWSGCEDLLWRSLARKCFLLTQPPSNPYLLQQQKQQGIKSPPPMLSVQHLCILANYLHQPEPWGSRRASVLFSEGETFTMDDIEGVILNLLDQGLIKGYIARGKMVVVLKRGDGQGFVSVEEARRWKAASRGSLNGGDDEWSGTTNGNGAKASGGGVVRLSGLRTIGT